MTKYWWPLPQAACYVRAWEEAYLHSWWASLFSLTSPCKSLNKSLDEFQNVSLLGGVTACWTWLSHSKPWSNLFYSILSQSYLILKGKEKFEVNQYILWWPQGQWASCGMLVLAWPDLPENERVLPLDAERWLMLCIYSCLYDCKEKTPWESTGESFIW